MFPDSDSKHSDRLQDLVDGALLKDLRRQPGPFAFELPEVDLEKTVLNRLAVLEVLCKKQGHTISILQAENSCLRSNMSATASYAEMTEAEDWNAKLQISASHASASSTFMPFKGSSHTLDGSTSSKHPVSPSIPALRQQTLSQPVQMLKEVHTLSDPASPLRPLLREEFLAKLPKVVVKGGQLLPVRSCIEAFIDGDDTALQFALGPSSAELQHMLTSLAMAAGSSAAAQEQTACTAAPPSRPQVSGITEDSQVVQKDCSTYDRSYSAEHADGHSSVRTVEASLGTQALQTTTVTSLRPPLAAAATRADAHLSPAFAVDGSSQDIAASSSIDEDGLSGGDQDAGCDQLVKYLLREFLGSQQPL